MLVGTICYDAKVYLIVIGNIILVFEALRIGSHIVFATKQSGIKLIKLGICIGFCGILKLEKSRNFRTAKMWEKETK